MGPPLSASVGTPSLWGSFVLFVVGMLALDLGIFHRKAHAFGLREAAAWSLVWVALAVTFDGFVYRWFGAEKALEFLTGYVIEKALSVDNLFVFLVIFRFFAVPAELQHRVLAWGILGALVLRALFILAGGALIAAFHVTIYVFGALLVYTGLNLLRGSEEELDVEQNLAVRMLRRWVPVVSGFRGESFVVREDGKLAATALLLCLVTIEASDLVFAIESIPAIFAVSRDPFIVFTSNIFAVLGLRALYFLLAGVMNLFHYLKVGLAAVLCFVGAKMLLIDLVKVPIILSLGMIATLLAGSIAASVILPPRARGRELRA